MLHKYQKLNDSDMLKINGGTDMVKCIAGGIGTGILSSTMGPIGYWAGIAVGYAEFCR